MIGYCEFCRLDPLDKTGPVFIREIWFLAHLGSNILFSEFIWINKRDQTQSPPRRLSQQLFNQPMTHHIQTCCINKPRMSDCIKGNLILIPALLRDHRRYFQKSPTVFQSLACTPSTSGLPSVCRNPLKNITSLSSLQD